MQEKLMPIKEIENLQRRYLNNAQDIIETLLQEIEKRDKLYIAIKKEKEYEINSLKVENIKLGKELLRQKNAEDNKLLLQKVMNNIYKYFFESDIVNLIKQFDLLVNNTKLYEEYLEDEHVQYLLWISCIYKYDDNLISAFNSIKDYILTNQDTIYRLIKQEKNVSKNHFENCIARYLSYGLSYYPVHGLVRKILEEIQKQCIPYVTKIKVGKELNDQCKKGNSKLVRRWVFLKDRGQVQAVEVWYCKKCENAYMRYEEFIRSDIKLEQTTVITDGMPGKHIEIACESSSSKGRHQNQSGCKDDYQQTI